MSKRFYYCTTGYGVFSLMGTKYSAGRIELYDTEKNTDYAIREFNYWVPHEKINEFRDFWDFLEVDFPLHVNMDMLDVGRELVAEELGVNVDKLNDRETINKYYKEKE